MLSYQALASWAIIASQLVVAFPQGGTGDLPGHGGQWQAAGKTDSRSPCPAINAAANIGVLPRNGKNITAEMLANAVVTIYNVDPSFAKTLASGVEGVAAKGAAISLADLGKHDIIEHDASLVRHDAIQGNNNDVQPKLVQSLLNDATGEYVTTQSIAKTRARREKESKAAGSPALGAKASTLAYGEAALLLQTLGHLGKQTLIGYNLPKKAVEEWLGQEKLPTGWVKPPKAITAAGTTALSAEILALAKLVRL